ncbi:LPS export ABC transporter permease LptF [Bdellovibrio sp. 22V]|uniref:LPS export ABC transporter permease LptF n=1 Tax=Bdellovibrio TaxID=958 RepID=UPI0025435A3F|nr:LPS export ABC transporter permease LptF [Bdellovibrio sp. 22V]WII73755.1 LPS export ABC transporter permease LptF [Bdellovibrio sp. 22V]
MSIFNGKKAAQYIFFEMLPSFILGLLVFISIILMFQVLRLTEFALIHGVTIKTIAEIIGYVVISLLPVLFPMALLFSVLLTYGRLSQDSEIVAMKASGLPMGTLLLPAVILATFVGVISAQMSFNIAPWGNRQFEVLFNRLSDTKAAAVIKEGTFSEGFFNMVVYANKVDSEKGLLTNVFIYDEKTGDAPLTIISKEGQIIPDPDKPGHELLLRLKEGEIHRQAKTHTKISFDTYDVKFSEPLVLSEKAKSPQSLTLQEVRNRLKEEIKDKEMERTLRTEYHKRWAISVLCLVFAMIGVGLGTTTNRRAAKAGGMIMCILIIIFYWALYVAAEGMARSGTAPVVLAIWAPNVIFGILGIEALRRNWN